MSKKIVSTFSERLKECLDNDPLLTATLLADKIGLSKQAISMYISGDRKPKRPTIKVISEILNVSESWLMGYDVPKYKCSNTKNNQYSMLPFVATSHEIEAFNAYHNQPEMQPAVDRILGVESQKKYFRTYKPHIEPIAAHANETATEQEVKHDDDIMDDENF